MRLKRLELQGFKSFANSVSLEFGSGVTAIVGPNGSGKSNIADAMRWVLGEQSAKSLRGQRMEDIIFAGSDGRKPLGMAQVHLTLDNRSGHLPLDYSEITVSRRLYRSGESEFLINKQNCRLKDIHELFTDTGLGREGCAIIGQGQVDTVLSARSEDRRVLLEETAGIVKYRRRKEEALKKLEDTNVDVLRVTDIYGELLAQLGPLQKEAEKARLYLNLTADLRRVELDCHSLAWRALQAKKEKNEAGCRQAKKDYEAAQAHCLSLEASSAELELRISSLEEKKEEKLGEKARLRDDFNEGLHKIQLYQERQKNNEARSTQLLRLSEEKSLELAKLGKEADSWEQKLAEIEQEIAAKEKEVLKNEALTKELALNLEKTKKRVNQLKDDFFEFMRRLTERRNFQRTFQEREKAYLAQLRAAEENCAELALALKQLESERAALKNEKLAAVDTLKEILQQQKNLAEEISARTAALAEINREKNKLEARFAQLDSRLKTLKELEAGYEGYGQGVRRLMQNRQLAPLILGTVAEIITVPEGLETAFEVALGGALQNVITETEEDAKKLIDWLKSAQAGRVTFLPLANMRQRHFSKANRALLNMPGVLGTGEELLQFQEKFRPAINSLLGLTVITADLDAALALKNRLRGFSRLVARDGSVVFPTGAMTGGSLANRAGLLRRKTEIDKLAAEAADLKQEILQSEKKSSALKKQTALNNECQAELQEKLLAQKLKEQRLSERENQLKEEIARGKKALLAQKEKIEDLEAAFESLGAEQKQAAAVVLELEGEEIQHRGEIQTMEESLAELEDGLLTARDKLSAHRVELAELNGRRENLAAQKKNTAFRKAEVERFMQEAALETTELAENRQFYCRAIADIEKTNAENETARAELREKLTALQSNLAQAKEEQKAARQNLSAANKNQTSKERALYKLEIESEQLAKEEAAFLETLADEKLTLREVTEREVTEKKAALKKQREQLRRKINNLGLVNPRAAHEYDRVKERCEFLEAQLSDLKKARQDLEDVINEMDKLCRTKLLKAFEQVRQEFQRLFARLFQGGRADLVLTDPAAVLTAGIDVLAQPPGKKLQNLLLLSGGERALTAIALLFAIRKVNPTPFCVLDEIDATLDESNLGRFAQLMKEFASDTQFLVITHRQATMEVAHTLYGVTMNEEATSQIVSVALAEEV